MTRWVNAAGQNVVPSETWYRMSPVTMCKHMKNPGVGHSMGWASNVRSSIRWIPVEEMLAAGAKWRDEIAFEESPK
jgi:hypothetical protein